MYPESIDTALMFLLPFWREPIQIVFFGLLCFSTAFYTLAIIFFSRPSQWEKNWQKYIASHTTTSKVNYSPAECSSIVTTSIEAVANKLPYTLLLLGLLGTAINLGVLIQKAAEDWYQLTSIDYVATPNFDLLINHGSYWIDRLGSAFRILAWGVIASLMTGIWLMFFDIETKRLLWCRKRLEAHVNA